MSTTPIQKILTALNSAYEADPEAIHALICNRVPCTLDLANHPHIVVGENSVTQMNGYYVTALGLLNGTLLAQGLPRVCAVYESGKFIRFGEYKENA